MRVACITLFAALAALKLNGTGAVALWSWWWVTSPLWAPLAVYLCTNIALFVVAFSAGMVRAALTGSARRKRMRDAMES